ncbi:hypothetical protein OIU79_002064, partial [Salix purpurea]
MDVWLLAQLLEQRLEILELLEPLERLDLPAPQRDRPTLLLPPDWPTLLLLLECWWSLCAAKRENEKLRA